MQLKNFVVLAKRGDCAFTTKAEIAQSGGASALLVINDDEGMAIHKL
jgi:signal peptide peptidase-like 2B